MLLSWSRFYRWLSHRRTHNSVDGIGTDSIGNGGAEVLSRAKDRQLMKDLGNLVNGTPMVVSPETITAHGANGADGLGSARINWATFIPASEDIMSSLPPDYQPPARVPVQLAYEIGMAIQAILVRRRIFFRTIKHTNEFEIIWRDAIEQVMPRFPDAHIDWEFNLDFNSGDRAHASGDPSEPASEGS